MAIQEQRKKAEENVKIAAKSRTLKGEDNGAVVDRLYSYKKKYDDKMLERKKQKDEAVRSISHKT